eukprot:jgi/Tetstr1/441370/TSEL_029619.t1
MTPQLRRADLQWWISVPGQSNGKPIHRPVETACLHTANSGYVWGGVLNGKLEARGFWSRSADERQHITYKELNAVTLHPELVRASLPARVVQKALTLAKALRLELALPYGDSAVQEAPPAGFPQSRSKGATTAAYVIGVMMQKVKYFGGRAMGSNVVLDYIDPM